MTGAALMAHLAEEGLVPNGRNCAALTGASNFGTTAHTASVGLGVQGPRLDIS